MFLVDYYTITPYQVYQTVDYYLLMYLSSRQMLGNPTKRDTVRVYIPWNGECVCV